MAIAAGLFFALVWIVVVLWIRSRGQMQNDAGQGGRGGMAGRLAGGMAGGLAGGMAGQSPLPGKLEARSVEIDGQERPYFILRKPGGHGTPRPVVLGLHGGGAGGAEIFLRRSGLAGPCFAMGMDLVLPQSETTWADGRETTIDNWQADRQFIETILAEIAQDPDLDENQVFAAGISNGAMFAIRLAIELAPRLRGICVVSGAVPEALSELLGPIELGPPLPILMVNSDDDRMVPMQGGKMPTMGGRAAGGQILSTAAAVRLWCQRNKCDNTPVHHKISIGNCQAQVSDYRGGASGADVTSIILHNAGHQWPSDRAKGQLTLEQLAVQFFQRQMALAKDKSQTTPSQASAANFNQGSLPT